MRDDVLLEVSHGRFRFFIHQTPPPIGFADFDPAVAYGPTVTFQNWHLWARFLIQVSFGDFS